MFLNVKIEEQHISNAFFLNYAQILLLSTFSLETTKSKALKRGEGLKMLKLQNLHWKYKKYQHFPFSVESFYPVFTKDTKL